jgi:hypothetical protein
LEHFGKTSRTTANVQQLKVCALFLEDFFPIDGRNQLCVIMFDNAKPGLGLEHAFLVIL